MILKKVGYPGDHINKGPAKTPAKNKEVDGAMQVPFFSYPLLFYDLLVNSVQSHIAGYLNELIALAASFCRVE